MQSGTTFSNSLYSNPKADNPASNEEVKNDVKLSESPMCRCQCISFSFVMPCHEHLGRPELRIDGLMNAVFVHGTWRLSLHFVSIR
jgi:hypothetical protein